MNDDILIGLVLLAVAGGLPIHRASFDAALVLFPPVVLTFFAGGVAELIAGFLRSGQQEEVVMLLIGLALLAIAIVLIWALSAQQEWRDKIISLARS